MVETLESRGPDGVGIYITEKARKSGRGIFADNIANLTLDLDGLIFENDVEIAMGHNRLSIIDIENRSQQPMHYDSEQYTIIFNGEIFNYIELKNELIKKGYKFNTKSDTEVTVGVILACIFITGNYFLINYIIKTIKNKTK